MTFLGLIVLENKLKNETKEVISTLKKAKIESIMATGDAILTGIAVAKSSGIVPDLN